MNSISRTKHSVDTIFSVLLFGLFSLMLLLLILFSAQSYRVSVQDLEENQNLHTAMTYVTTKVRQHDGEGDVYLDSIENLPALCLNDEIDGTIYTTYIYLDDSQLRELFTVPGASVSASLGTSIAELSSFQIEETAQGFLKLYMEDFNGNSGELLLHPASPKTDLEISSGKEELS